ncbi:MAG: DUF4857 domain-containing protein [Bacteroidales bacterium]|nr:DUF4857 domain-containing protein [Bacteroidales bacterium]
MRISKTYYYILLFAIGFCVSLSVPYLVQIATYTPPKYPLVLYSSQLKDIVYINYSDNMCPMTDRKGRKYTTSEFDSLMPLLNYRQLIADGRMPSKIGGFDSDAKMIRSYQTSFRISPTRKHQPKHVAYPVFESIPRRVGAINTDYIFSLDKDVEIYDISLNKLDKEKTQLLKNELLRRNFTFPAQWVIGNTATKKRYDEGYFVLDADGKLFHMKMVNSRPFVRDTHLTTNSGWHSFHPYEPTLHNFYGILISNDGKLARVNIDDNGSYYVQWLDIPNIDPDIDYVRVLGNLLYWNVTVTKPEGEYTYALNAWMLSAIDSAFVPAKESTWNKINKWTFPFIIRLKQENSLLIEPKITDINVNAIWVHILLVGIYAYRKRRHGSHARWYAIVALLCFGLGAFLAIAFLPKNDIY